MTCRQEWLPPERFDEYRLLQALGRSSRGQVWLAHDTVLDRLVAVKLITELPTRDAVRQRFLTEARAAARVQHPNIVAVYRTGELAARPYLVSEYVRGRSLDKLPRPVAALRVREIAIGLARGLAAAHHQGVVLGALALSNVIMSDSGEIKLRSFELATLAPSASEAGSTAPTMRSDVYAFGAVLYALATGEPPPEDASKIMTAGIDPCVATVVERCLRRDPTERFESGEAVRAALEALLVDASSAAHTSPSRLRRPRSALLLSAASAACVLIARFAWPSSPVSHCPAGMTLVSAGTFRMGSPEGRGDTDEHPQHDVTLSAYCIDTTEVTVAAYHACVVAGHCRPSPLSVNLSNASEAAHQHLNLACNADDHPDHPINCVDWDQAATYCRWNAKRLPSEAEWEYAARGSDDRVYPWGDAVPTAQQMKLCDHECLYFTESEYNDDNGWRPTLPVASFPQGASPFGVLDMAGNVREWTADWYAPYTAQPVADPQGPSTGTSRVSRGGAGVNWNTNHKARAADRDWPDPIERSIDLGFRCARGA